MRTNKIPPDWIEAVELPTPHLPSSLPAGELQGGVNQVNIENKDIQMFKDALTSPTGEGDGLFGVNKRARGHPFRLTCSIKTKIVHENSAKIVKLQKSLSSIGCLTTAFDRFVFCQRMAELQNLNTMA